MAALITISGVIYIVRKKKYEEVKTGKENTGICIKLPKVSRSSLGKEVLEGFLSEYLCLVVYQSQSRESPMIQNKG